MTDYYEVNHEGIVRYAQLMHGAGKVSIAESILLSAYPGMGETLVSELLKGSYVPVYDSPERDESEIGLEPKIDENTELRDLDGADLPNWVDQGITAGTVHAIVQGGCESGAYMPAVTYHEARETMGRYGNEVIEYVWDRLETLPFPEEERHKATWDCLCVFYLSVAVELLAHSLLEDLESRGFSMD